MPRQIRKKKGAHLEIPAKEPLRIKVQMPDIELFREAPREARWGEEEAELRVGTKVKRPPPNITEYRNFLWKRFSMVKPPIPAGEKEAAKFRKQMESLRTQIYRRQLELKEGKHIAFKEAHPPTRSKLYKLVTAPFRWTFGWFISPEPLTGSRVFYGAPLTKKERKVREIDLDLRMTQLKALETKAKLNSEFDKFKKEFMKAFYSKEPKDWNKAEKLIKNYRKLEASTNKSLIELERKEKSLAQEIKKIAPEYIGFVFR